MVKLLSLVAILWFCLFLLRVSQVGGLNSSYFEPPRQLLEPLQRSLTGKIDEILPSPQSKLLSGILLGSGQGLPFTLKKQLQTTSTIHIVVVSGQNLTMLSGFVMSLAGFLGRKRAISASILIIIFYSVLTGLQIPVVRAAIMATLGFTGQLLGKERTGWWLLVVTAALMLLYNPNWLFSISFQLSFVATAGVIVVAPELMKLLEKIPNILRQDLAIAVSAYLLTLPLIASNFGQISIYGILVNILIGWTISLVMIGGFISLILALIMPFLGQLTGLFPSVLLTYFIYLVQFFAKLPASSFSVGPTNTFLWVGYYLLIIAGVWAIKIKKGGRPEEQNMVSSKLW